MNFNEPYLAYKELVKAREKAKNFKRVKFKDRILTLTRSKPNPKFGGYFISPNGVADNDGRSYLTPITPSEFEKIELKDFDKVYFERGQIYNFNRTITTNNNTFGSYGSGADPKFYGSTTFSAATWTSEAGGYYSTPLATAPKWVFNPAGEAARQGQSDWIPVTAGTAGTPTRTFDTAILNPFNTVQSLVNCKARFKEFNFRMSYEYTIGAYDSGTGVVTFDANVVGSTVGYPMFLYGQKQFATLEGDWWYDTAGAKLWIKTASDPTGLDWRVCTENFGLLLNAATGTTITGLEFTQYYETAIRTFRASNTSIAANIHDIRTDGLFTYGNNTGTISYTGTITRCGLNGINVGGVSNFSISGSITSCGKQLNYPWPINTTILKSGGCAIACFSDTSDPNELATNIQVTEFVASDTAYMGCLLLGTNHLAEHCHIFNCLQRFDDGGGLYSYYQNSFGGSGTSGNIFRSCIIHDIVGSSEGIENYTQNSIASCIYLDNGTNNTEVDSCTLYTAPWAGVFSNWNTEDAYIHDCTIANNGHAQVIFYEQPDATSSPNFLNNYKNVLEDNIIVATTGQSCIFTASDGVNHNPTYNPFTTGNSDRNTYVQLNTRATTTTNPVSLSAMAKHADSVFNFGSTQPGATVTYVTFAGWQTRNSDDAASTVQGFYLDNTLYTEALDTIVVLANPTGTTANVDIVDNTYNDLAGATINSASVPAWSSVMAVIKPTYFYLMDGILGSTGASISGRAPKIGNTPNILSGTHTISTTNKIQSSVAGLISWNVGAADFVYEVKMRGSIAGGSIRMDVRYADATASVTHRLIVDITTATGVRIRENNDSGTLVELGTGAAFTFAANTDYAVKIIANGSNLKVYVDDVLYRDQAVNVVTGNYVAIFNDVSTNVNQTDYVVAYPI